jgi:hypothetical protein
MKIWIHLVLFILSIFPVLADHASVINFADSNFENAFRRNVERGLIYLPSYTGPEYQFTQADLANVSWLDLDGSDLTINSLADLQWFTNLQGFILWDASEVSDFSPVWALSGQLKYLAINGSRGANLSGVSNMDNLVYLDLEDNQLTDLSILGDYPELMELNLVGNFLDLSDSEVMAKINSISNQIENRQNSLGYWYYDLGVDYEPQYPAGFRNLSSEVSRVDAILSSSPNDAEANLLRGLYSLLNIMESTNANGLKEFAVSVGVDPAIRDFVLSDLPALESYDVELDQVFQLGELAEMMENSIIPSLESADLSFSKVPDSSVIELSQEMTGWENLVNIDKVDVLILRSMTNILAGLAALQSSSDWNVTAGHMEDLDETDLLNAEQIRAHNPNFGGIRSAVQLAKSKTFFQNAIDLYQEASPLLVDFNRLDVPNRLFVLSIEDLADEAEFREALLDVESALSGPYVLDQDSGERIDLSRLFSAQVDLANLMPENRKNKFTTDQLTDPTMGGLLPDWTQRRVSDESEEAELLWDDRAMVFWRLELFEDGSYSANPWNKQSVVLKYLGDESEEVLYSVNAKELVVGLGLDSTTTSGYWLQESKVCISPDGSQLIFGYALMPATMEMSSENRLLVRIIKYDLTSRASSMVRDWSGSNLSDSIDADYVDFCIDALEVDWNNEKIYFSE